MAQAGSPARGRTLRARGQRTLARLLEAGAEVFATRGYHAARVDDVVKAAETSHGTFYLYFASKEELFRALAEEAAGALADQARQLGDLRPGPEGEAELRAWLEGFAEAFERHGPVIRAWTEAEAETSAIGELGTDLLGTIAAVLAERIAASPAEGLDPPAAGLALVAMVERVLYQRASGQVRMSRATAVDALTRTIQDGLFGPEVSPA